jgi:hypothetical protein
MTGGADGRAPSMDVFQSLDSTALTTNDLNMAVSRAKLFRPLLRGVGRCRDQHLSLNPGAGPAPLREGVASTRVTLFRSIFGCLHDFILSSC